MQISNMYTETNPDKIRKISNYILPLSFYYATTSQYFNNKCIRKKNVSLSRVKFIRTLTIETRKLNFV